MALARSPRLAAIAERGRTRLAAAFYNPAARAPIGCWCRAEASGSLRARVGGAAYGGRCGPFPIPLPASNPIPKDKQPPEEPSLVGGVPARGSGWNEMSFLFPPNPNYFMIP